ncbi:MAG: hypothetical protein HYW48_00445 [Deltaproteobacteria bacterium]|nr:hypothetical protein [Deltaproteobacteria bacterium]
MRQPIAVRLVVFFALNISTLYAYDAPETRRKEGDGTKSVDEIDRSLNETNTILKDMANTLKRTENTTEALLERWDQSNQLYNQTAPAFLEEWRESNNYFGIFLNETVPRMLREWKLSNEKLDSIRGAADQINEEWVRTNQYLAVATNPFYLMLGGASLGLGALVMYGITKLAIAKCKWPSRCPTFPSFRRVAPGPATELRAVSTV